ncbi:uroporphyrinogen-III synthase [Parerythrobacter jejuensis]|uniref:Uroporphyrinogen-III synthase n=1 Tax=Parerythrobacter jejuensis TaxID=795812 RepID=A0A845ATM1_9SPHN|nr:uroporphyrinogen-III synthase [Parerythrobacter jejuensis]MXP32944.1 uroporphyrinogen-III synthase [Parerythrobacter jejuensis]
MSVPIFVLRPEPGLTATLVAAFEAGLKAKGMALSSVEPVTWSAPAKPFDGLLIGSANAVRHAGKELDKVSHLPVLAVGATTAKLAQEAGLQVEHVGSGGLQDLIDTLPGEPRHLLRLAGEVHVALDVPAHLTLDSCVVYRVQYRRLSADQAGLLSGGAIVLLHSGEAGRHFAEECTRLGVDRSRVDIAAMAPRILENIGDGWRSVHVADGPSDAALLDLAGNLCH